MGNQLAKVGGRKILLRHHQDRRDACNADGREVIHRIVFEAGVERRGGSMCSHLAHDQRVAIGRGGGYFCRCRGAASTRLVFHHDLLAQRLRHVLSHNAGNHVRRASSSKGHHKSDRLGRIVFGHGGRTHQQCGRQAQ